MGIYFKLSPELSDGISPEITKDMSAIQDRVLNWIDEFSGSSGESFSIETVEMSEDEFNKLREE